MGRFFSDKVETAIRYIYYDLGAQHGQDGFRLLQEACREGDADAYCLLARCLYGQEYTWLGHDFPVDEGRRGRAGIPICNDGQCAGYAYRHALRRNE